MTEKIITYQNQKVIIKELLHESRFTHTHETYALNSIQKMQHHATTPLPLYYTVAFPLTGYRT